MSTIDTLARGDEQAGVVRTKVRPALRRILGVMGALVVTVLVLAPVVTAAQPFHRDGRFVIAVRGDVTLPADQAADVLIIAEGTATIEGDVGTVLVLKGTANFVGSTIGEIVAIAGTVNLDGTSVVSGDVQVLDATITRAPGALVQGTVREGLNWAEGAMFIGPALFILYVGFVVVAMVGAVGLAAVGSRQVRAAEALLNRRIGSVAVAGLAGLIGITMVGALAFVTIIGIPLGLAILLGFLPIVYFIGYLVAGIWVGEWILRRGGGEAQARPYLAAVIGVLVVSLVSIVPVVGGVLGFLGFGAVLLLMWQTARGGPSAAATVPADAVPVPAA